MAEATAGLVSSRSSRFVILARLTVVLSLIFSGLVATPAAAADYAELPQHVIDAFTQAGGKCEGGVCEPAHGRSSVTIDGKVVGVDLLQSSDFRGWQVKGFDFLNLNLSHSKWDHLERVNWTGVSGSYLRLAGAKMTDFHISESTLVDATFLGAQGTGVALSSVKLKDCDLSWAHLDGSRADGQSNHEWVNVSFVDGTEVDLMKISHVSTDGIELKNVKGAETLTISNSDLEGKDVLALAKAGVKKFPANQITGTLGSNEKVEVLENLDLAGSSFSAFHLRNLIFKECNLQAINTNADRMASITNVKIIDGTIDHGNLSNVDAKKLEIRMANGGTVKGFVMINANVDRGVIDGKFTDSDFSHTVWIKSNLADLRGDPNRPLKVGEFHVYLGGGHAQGTVAPVESRRFDYKDFTWAEESVIPDNALVDESRLSNMDIDKSTRVGSNFEIRNCPANNLQARGLDFKNLKVVDSDLAKANFNESSFSGNTKFDRSIVEEVTFKGITLKGQIFRFTSWIRNILIRIGWMSPSSTVSFDGAEINGDIDFTGSRTDGENRIDWRGTHAEPGAKVVLDSRAEAEQVSAEMQRAGVAMDRMQVEYMTKAGPEVLHEATVTGGTSSFTHMAQVAERDKLAKTTEAFYKKAEAERRVEQAKIRQELQQKYPKPNVK